LIKKAVRHYGSDSLYPPDDGTGEGHSSDEVGDVPIKAGCDAAPVLQTADYPLVDVAFAI
jgi:hypothetical protein